MPSFFMIGVMALFISLLHGTPVLAASCEVGTYACGDVCISVAEFCCAQGSVSCKLLTLTGSRKSADIADQTPALPPPVVVSISV